MTVFFRKWWGFLILCAFLLVTALIAFNYKYPTLSRIKSHFRSSGFFGWLIFALIYLVASLFFVPKNILTLVAGSVFGFFWGTSVVLIGSMTGALLAFAISRYLGQEVIEQVLIRRAPKIERYLSNNQFRTLLTARLIPVVPFTLLNYAAGLSPIRTWRYTSATILGILPGTLSYILIGAYGIHPKSWQFGVGLLLLVILFFSNRLMRGRE
jgi:uncharacterized membrane protein YdjX (TVP38/TMEM64 family)